MRPALRVWRGAKNSHQTRRIRIRKEKKKKFIKPAEHRRVDADAERDREHCDSSKSFVFQQQAEAIAHVLRYARHTCSPSSEAGRCGIRLNFGSNAHLLEHLASATCDRFLHGRKEC